MNDVFPHGERAPAVVIGNPFSSMTAVEAVRAKIYDAGVAREKRFREVAVEQKLVSLHRFEETGDLLVAGGTVPAESARAFQQVLVKLKDWQSDQVFLDAPAHFRAATEKDFKEIANKLELESKFEEE